MNKSTMLLLAMLVPCITHAETIYEKLQPINMSSLPFEDDDWPHEEYGAYIKRLFDYQNEMHPRRQRRAVLKIFNSVLESYSSDQHIHNVLYDTITMQDLNLCAGPHQGDTYIAEIIDRTNTTLGKMFLYGLLANPTNDVEILTARQNIIKHILSDTQLDQELTGLYKVLKATENMVLSLYLQDGFSFVTDRSYFTEGSFLKKEKLNRSVIAMESKIIWDHSLRLLWWGTGSLSAVVLPVYALNRCKDLNLPFDIQNITDQLGTANNRTTAFISWLLPYEAVKTGLVAASGALYAAYSQEEFRWMKDNFIADRFLQRKMRRIAHFFTTVLDLNKALRNHPEFLETSPAAAKITQYMKELATDKAVQKFLNICKTATLQDSYSICSIHGRVLAAFKLIQDSKKKFEPLLMAIGELDAYLSCAHTYTEFQNKPATLCFAQYVSGTVPYVKIEDFWNPFIDPEKVVTNSIEFAGPDHKNIIITGPNAGGKSTIIKAIPVNLILSQSIGLAAARSAVITPFYSIATYLNVVDNIVAGNSLLKAQVKRAQEMIHVVENTPTDLFSFIALDEMFNGTSPHESMATAYSVIEDSGQQSNTMLIAATHFSLLTKLEQENKGFINYKVSVDINEGIHYPFKLERGISNQHIALDILLHEGYNNRIVTKARTILKNLKI